MKYSIKIEIVSTEHSCSQGRDVFRQLTPVHLTTAVDCIPTSVKYKCRILFGQQVSCKYQDAALCQTF